MNEKQLLIFLQQAFAAENLGADVVRAVMPQMRQALANIQSVVENLPDDSLIRKMLWQQSLPDVVQAFEPYNEALGTELITQMAEHAPEQIETAKRFLEAGAPGQPLVTPELPSSVATRMAANTEFVNTKLVDLFSTAKGPSPFMVKNAERINKIVQRGIFQNQTTQQIASDLQTMAAKITRSEAFTIARTSIQSFNNTTNNDVWSANEHLIDKWEWVAALDSKTCPICAPEDGQVRDKRRDFPRQPPAHPNCRCQILPYWEDQAVRQRPAQQVYKEEQSGARAYKTQVKVKGEKFYRKAVDVQPVNGKAATYADFIAKANSTTKQTFFGGGNAGRVRAERFDALNARYKDPQRALNALVNTSTGGFKKLDRLPTLEKS